MANALYDKARESFLGQSPPLDWDTDVIKDLLATAAYAANLATDQYLTTTLIANGNRAGSPVTLTSKTVAAGVADAADVTHTAVAAGTAIGQIILWKDGGGGGTSASGTTDPLIARIDTATGLPVTPNGGDITITWDNGSNRIFKL
jgi:hypothetical protein